MPIEKELDCIEHSGGLFTDEIIHSLRKKEPSIEEVEPRAFSFNGFEPETQTDLDSTIGQAWDALKEKWDKFYREKSGTTEELSVSDTRRLWISPLFRQLGYQPEWIKSSLERGGKSFNLAHRGWDSDEAPVLHSVKPGQSLDDKPTDAGRGARSPHDLVQEFLNLDQSHLWAILTNGLRIRLIRDFYHEVTKGYLEFDLENIFESRRYDDFRALYRLCHASRFLSGEDTKIRVETIHEKSRTSGITAGKELRGNVREAIEFLANGLLKGEPLDSYKESTEKCEEFYEEVLTVIYRVLFLLFAEQRGMVPSQDLLEEHSGGSTGERSLYSREYSITSLRERAEQGPGSVKHSDLWEGLQVTFDMFKEGRKELGIFPYNGELFDKENTPQINEFSCSNKHLLKVIRSLTLIEREGILQRINYARIGVEEIGAIYENLLDYQPRVPSEDEEVDGETLEANTFVLDPRGSKRKGTGSYYTRPSLVNQLIETSLKPVIEERIEEQNTQEEKEEALLDIKVCDPACGSAAFLIRANNILAQRLAKIRTDSNYPSEREIMEDRRDVLRHCIYGVDLNTMAVELAKVSLWINATVQDKPLNFLNHRIQCGNSLIGTLPGDIERGITDETFSLDYIPEGDDRELVKELRRKTRKENSGMREFDFGKAEEDKLESEVMDELGDISEETAEDIDFKREFYSDYLDNEGYKKQKFIHDLWTAAFFWKNIDKWDWCPTPVNFEKALESPSSVPEKERKEISRLAEDNNFFHWHLAFPEIFKDDRNGFDCMLGNPPWDRIELKEKEFFAGKEPEIVNTSKKNDRLNLIEELQETDPGLYEDYLVAKRKTDLLSKFVSTSDRFPLSSQGFTNIANNFVELNRQVINSKGSIGMIIPSGLATDKTVSEFFRDLMENHQIESWYDFENREGLFPEVHRSYKFSLITLRGKEHDTGQTDFSFFLTNLDQLSEDDRHFQLEPEEINLLNPNTKTCPVFRDKDNAQLTKKLYRQAPVLINEENESNPWNVKLKRIFNMGKPKVLEKCKEQTADPGEDWVPMYESKLMHQYDHRWATYEEGELKDFEKDDSKKIRPKFWIKQQEVKKALKNKWPKDRDWLLVYRDITNVTNERTVISTILPRVGTDFTLRVAFPGRGPKEIACLLGNFNSFVFNYVARQFIGGTHLSDYIMKQLPVQKPTSYQKDIKSEVVKKVLELVYTSEELKGFAKDLDYYEEPFKWDIEKRFNIRCKLDAIYAHLYKVTKDELDYILDTFPIVKRQDEEEYGAYRTKERILEEYKKLS